MAATAGRAKPLSPWYLPRVVGAKLTPVFIHGLASSESLPGEARVDPVPAVISACLMLSDAASALVRNDLSAFHHAPLWKCEPGRGPGSELADVAKAALSRVAIAARLWARIGRSSWTTVHVVSPSANLTSPFSWLAAGGTAMGTRPLKNNRQKVKGGAFENARR